VEIRNVQNATALACVTGGLAGNVFIESEQHEQEVGADRSLAQSHDRSR
jgi:hypothetical protein